MTHIHELQEEIAEFAKARNWESLHTPKNLCLALSAEIGELSAEFLWLAESESKELSIEKHKLVGLEIADIAIYLIRLADTLNINIADVVFEKMKINETRFPRLHS